MAKTLDAIEKGLEVEYAGPTFEKNGFTYIPWNEAAKVANRVFGIDGYSVDVLEVANMGSGYMARVRVTVKPSDAPAFYRDGIGFNELTGDNGRAHDTALKGAPSDALNRALKLFGQAFGLNLYDKEPSQQKQHAQSATSSQPRTTASATSSGNDKRPSEKQMFYLRKHYSDDAIDAMAFNEWKKAIDDIFAGKAPVAAAAAPAAKTKAPTKKPVAQADDVSDDEIPF